jgi:hypothetical protein
VESLLMSEYLRNVGPSQRLLEVAVALGTMAFGVIVTYGSLQAGIDWGAEGPKAGFFPFYVGLAILGCSLVNLVQMWTDKINVAPFAEWSQLRQVLSIVVPTAVYVALIPYLGIYVTSAALIALFMIWFGRYGWLTVVPISIGVPLVIFAIFELWFVVALPKGPIEDALGF